MASLAKQDSAAFHSLTEPLIKTLINVQSKWPNLDSICFFFSSLGVTVGLVIFSILVLFTCLKIRKLLTAVVILNNI
jgi:hypothetical protein